MSNNALIQWIVRLAVCTGLASFIFFPIESNAQWKLLFQPNDSVANIAGTPYFLNLPGPPRIGFITGYDTMDNFRRYGARGVIFKTTNGGETWRAIPITLPNGSELRGGAIAKDIVFKDSMTGWAGAFKTTDQGNTWFPFTSGFDPTGLYYDSLSDGLFAATWGATWTTHDILVSWDEGDTWQAVPNSPRGCNGFAFGKDSAGILSTCYSYGGIPTPWMRTEDAGKTWQSITMDSECWQPIAIAGTETQFAITDVGGNILRTDNLWDSSWVVYSFPFEPGRHGFTNGCIRGDSNHLFVHLVNGVYMSTDQGRSWRFLCGQPYDTAELYDGYGNDIGSHPMYDHRFWVRYPYVSILTYPPTNPYEPEVWMLNVDSMQYFPTGIAFADGTKRTSVQAGTPVTIKYSPKTSDPIGIDTGHLVFRYNPDALELKIVALPPGWKMIDSISLNGGLLLDFTADSSAAIPSPMVSLTFNTFLSPSSGTSVRIYLDAARLTGHRLNCDCQALSTGGPDSVEIDFTGCGDSTILAAMNHAPPFTIESIVPNPAQTEVTVTVSGIREPESGVSYQLFDALGNCVLSQHASAASLQMDVANLPSGIYFLRVSDNGYAQSRSVVIER